MDIKRLVTDVLDLSLPLVSEGGGGESSLDVLPCEETLLMEGTAPEGLGFVRRSQPLPRSARACVPVLTFTIPLCYIPTALLAGFARACPS